jgi:predicted PurR-regulated permease PerM
MLKRWREFRRHQLEVLRESNRPVVPEDGDGQLEQDLLGDVLRRDESPDGVAPSASTEAQAESVARYGTLGRPINKQSPFYLGFVGALGALVAIGLWHSLSRLATTLTILLIAFFLTLALNPLVEGLASRGVRRPSAVAIVFAGLVLIFTLIGLLVVPPVVQQGADLATNAPIQDADRNYHVIERLKAELNKRLTDGTFMSQIMGGVLGAGRAVASGVFQTLTVLILTLYFLASFPKVKQAAYGMVPASRRTRVISLSEEIMRRTGSYAIGQAIVAAVNAAMSWLMMLIVGIPYAAVLAVAVGILGLVPMVGATLGAAVVSIVAFFDEPRKALIAIVYYLVYQQVENYLVAPRVMQRTISVPGAVTVVAALAGGTLLGLLGALLAIPVAAGLLLLYEEVLLPRQRRV